MRKLIFSFFCLAFGLSLLASPIQHIATSNPIIPIRMTADTMRVALTDYVPGLMADAEWLKTHPQTEITLRSNHIDNLLFQSGKQSCCVVVLPNKPQLQALVTEQSAKGLVTVRLLNQSEHPALHAYIQNMPVEDHLWQAQGDGRWTLNLKKSAALKACNKGRAYLRIYAEDLRYLYNDILIPLQNGQVLTDASQLTRHDDQAQVLYSILIDRFEDGNPNNNQPLRSSEVMDIADYQGGDLAGITSRIEAGYFDQLGVNTLWISPITQNPLDAWGKYVFKNGNKYDPTRSYTRFSGYHGYWPIYATCIDHRLGTEAELTQLLQVAHNHHINVVLDYVANHMHINSPTLQQHPTWHTDSILPDGRRNFELWDEARLTTWFDTHIPTLDLERPEVCQAMTDSALYWLDHFALDGFRHDACKHIPEGYWRMLSQKMAQRYPNRHLWMIGETYGSPELINTYVKSGMLNAQFDFNVYFTAIHALCNDGKMSDLDQTIRTSQATYGAHHTMGNISGNHDQARFASFAGGAIRFDEDPKEAGWTRHVGIGDSATAYRRALLLEVLNLTLPGVPCIYQGDEYAEVGGNDPDNRKMMRFDGLNEQEQQFRAKVQELIKMRRQSMPLLYGDYIPVMSNDDVLSFDRVYMGETVRVTIDRRTLTYSIEQQPVTRAQHPDFAYPATIYELNTRQLTPEGTFAAAEKLLPKMKECGIDILWIMPCQPIGKLTRKGSLGSYYSIIDYCAFNPEFGTRKDFESLLNKAHELGMKVILDWVANHTAPDSRWTENYDWHYRDSAGNLMVQYDWTDISKLNYNNQAMRQEMLRAMHWWMDSIGIDGFRCDVAGEVPTDFWNWAMADLRKTHPNMFTLAENEDKAQEFTASAFDAYYGWELHHLMNSVAQGKQTVADLWRYFDKVDRTLRKEAIRMNFTSNHDENSWNGTEYERLGDAFELFTAFTYIVPGMPMIYTGQPSGNHHRLSFFEKDTIDVVPDAPQMEMYRKFNTLRDQNPALWSNGKGAAMLRLPTNNDQVFACVRTINGNTVMAVMNMSAQEQAVSVDFTGYADTYHCMCGSEQTLSEHENIILSPWQYLIFSR